MNRNDHIINGDVKQEMTYDEFKNYVVNKIPDYLEGEFKHGEISVERMVKNNDTILDGIRIFTKDSGIAPVVYLNGAFEQYSGGMDVDRIVEQLAQTYMRNITVDLGVDYSQLTNWEAVKDHVTFRVVNAENNQERLANAPHTDTMDDLTVSYHVQVSKTEDGVASLLITDDLMVAYGVTKEELHEIAMQNTKSIDPPVFRALSEVMIDTMVGDFMAEYSVPEEEAREMLSDMLPSGGPDIYCLTNTTKINGATSILYPDVQQDIYDKVGDFYMLPSSIHETLIVPKAAGVEVAELVAMVQEVNATQVLPQERLSDHVYEYDAKTQKISRADQGDINHDQNHENNQEHNRDNQEHSAEISHKQETQQHTKKR